MYILHGVCTYMFAYVIYQYNITVLLEPYYRLVKNSLEALREPYIKH